MRVMRQDISNLQLEVAELKEESVFQVDNKALQLLLVERAQRSIQLAALQSRYTPDHTEVQQVQKRLAVLDVQIEELRALL